MKKQVATIIAKISLNMAKKASNSASIYGLHQPKEPKSLKNFK